MSGYDLDVIGSGQFRASASSTSSSLARSVAGRAGA
jgi:hypothetical protein